MRGGEVQLRVIGDQRELDALVGHPDAEDVALWWFDAERSQRVVVRLAQRTLPGEQLLADPPFVWRSLLGELQLTDDAGDVVPGGHDSLCSLERAGRRIQAAALHAMFRLISVAA